MGKGLAEARVAMMADETDNLAELVDEYTRAEGDFTPEELAVARADLYGSEGKTLGHVV